MPKPVLLLDNYLNPDGAWGFFHPFLDRADLVRVHAVSEPLPRDPLAFSGMVVTGSAASVWEERDWSVAATELIRRFVDARVPTLGVCYGHQLLGEAMGGRGTVRAAPQPEVGYLEVELERGDPLFDALPQRFRAFLTHGDEVQPRDGFEVVGRSELCPVQAIRVPGAPAWGVQFHTEYDEPEQLRLLHMRANKHPEQGYQPEEMFAGRIDTSAQAETLFGRFLELVGW